MTRLHIALFALSALALAGCNPKSDFGDTSVIGPDLGHGGPFGAVHEIAMTDPHQDKDDRTPMRMTIHRDDSEDTGQVVNMFSNTSKPFGAGITYYGFTPIIAETNAEAHTYWLLGINMTRTPDRSVYMVLRYPRGLEITPGLKSDAFEYLALNCYDLEVARHPAEYYKPLPEGQNREEPAPDPAPEAGDCEYNSLREAQSLTGLTLQKYDQIHHYEDAPKASWHALHVEAN